MCENSSGSNYEAAPTAAGQKRTDSRGATFNTATTTAVASSGNSGATVVIISGNE